MKTERIDWKKVLPIAAEIVESYDTGVTLRQLFYRLVAKQIIPNTITAYKTLSDRTAEARRQSIFPALIDRTRSIHQVRSFENPQEAIEWLSEVYRRDRTEGQETNVYLGVEKHGMVEQLRRWFNRFGVSIVSLGGYSSQTYVDDILESMDSDGRPAILIYAGDWDPSGEDIDRDFTERCNQFAEVLRIALTEEQVQRYQLPEAPGKSTDSRASGFVEKYGRLSQVELDALDPDTLRELYTDALNQFVDMSIFEDNLEKEKHEREWLKKSFGV